MLHIVDNIITVLCLIVIIWSLFGLVRNQWVFTKRMWIIANDLSNYDTYLSYDEMLLRFWVWDISKLKKPGL